MRRNRTLLLTVILAAMLAALVGQTRPAQAGWLALFEGAEGTAEAVHGVGLVDLLRAPEGGYTAFAGAGRSDEGAGTPDNLQFVRLRLGPQGEIRGQRGYLGPRHGVIREARITSDGGQILVGDFFEPAPRGGQSGPPVMAPDEVSEGWIIKLNAGGGVDWARRFDDIRADGARTGRHHTLHSIAQAQDGGYVAVGYTHRRVPEIAPGKVPDMDMWIVRLDAAGDLLWQRRIGGDQIDGGMAIRRVPAGGFIAAGLTSGREAFATSGDLWLVRLDEAGRILWQKSYGGPTAPARGMDAGWRIAPMANGDFVVAGSTRSFGRGGGAKGDIWMMRLGPQGGIRWQSAYGGEKLDTGAMGLLVTENALLVAGYSNSFGPADPADFDSWVLKLGHDGAVRWQQRLGGKGRVIDQLGGGFAPAPDGYLAAGITSAFTGERLRGHGLLIKFDRDGAIGAFPENSPLQLKATDARRRATDATPRTVDAGMEAAGGRMTAWRPEGYQVRLRMRYVVAPDNGDRADGDGDCVPPGPVTESYVAHIGPHDLINSAGERLQQPWQILRQDRANYHRFGLRDPRDEGEDYFATAEARARIPEMYETGGVTGGINSEVAAALVEGGTTVKVDIHDCGSFLHIKLLSQKESDADQQKAATEFSCKADACLHGRTTGAVTPPPNDKCWGWYPEHSYNLLRRFDAPLGAARIEAFVTGGPSELREMREGFRLEALPANKLTRGARLTLQEGPGCDVLEQTRGWRTLRSFAAPVTSGDRITIRWQGDLPQAAALRIRAPGGLYVDNSGLTVEAADGTAEDTLTEADDGRTVRVAPDEQLRVRLPANPSTGHSWAVTRINPEILKLEERDYTQDPECEGKPGCGGQTTFTFTANAEGRTELRLDHARHWDETAEPTDIFGVTVVVSGADQTR